MTVTQLLEQWQRNALPARELSPRTIDVYRWCIEVLTETIGTRRVDRLAPEHVEEAFAGLAEHGREREGRPLSRASLIKIRSVLGKALEYGQRRQLVSRNVARVVELPPQPGEARRADPSLSSRRTGSSSRPLSIDTTRCGD